MSTLDIVRRLFEQTYSRPPGFVVRAPGRVNLIGDHTDYNDGFVLPMAVGQSVWMAVAPRTDRRVRAVSANGDRAAFELDHLQQVGGLSDYLSGVIWAMGEASLRGMDVAIASELPIGAGLSSSAALQMAMARASVLMAGSAWDPVAAARACQRAENSWVGVETGIMDQLICGIAKSGRACLIDCRSLELSYRVIPEKWTVAVLDTSTRRSLVGSVYNERRESCRNAAKAMGVGSLRDADLELLGKSAFDSNTMRRARHVITENQRTLDMAEALSAGSASKVGDLMAASHASLRYDYEVSTAALDALVEAATASPGCIGARLTGAGLGGCAVAVVEIEQIGSFRRATKVGYRNSTGLEALVYASGPAAAVDVDWANHTEAS